MSHSNIRALKVSGVLTLALLVGLNLELREVSALLVGDVTDISEVNGRLPAGRLPSLGDLGVELVNLLEGKTLGLVDKEVDEDKADATEATPDEEHLGLEVGVLLTRVDQVGSSVGDGPVEQPVGGGGDGQTLGTGLEGEQFCKALVSG